MKCYLPIEFLKVSRPIDLPGLRLLPLMDPAIPQPFVDFEHEPYVGSVAELDVAGKDRDSVNQARACARHNLRLLRVALRASSTIHDYQLRFRVGRRFILSEGGLGFSQHQEVAFELGLSEELLRLVDGQELMTLPVEPRTDIERKAGVALGWIERSFFAGESIVALLYLFFALEALLGVKSEKRKGYGLAFRQALLSHIGSGGFTHPNITFYLYDEVRSAAVHGEAEPPVTKQEVRSFANEVRWTLIRYLSFAKSQELQKRSRLLAELDKHSDRDELIAWLMADQDKGWEEYFASIKDSSGGR